MGNRIIQNPGRRNFLRIVPAAAATLTLANTSIFSSVAVAQGAPPQSDPAFQVIPAQTLQEDAQAQFGKPGSNTLVNDPNFTFVLFAEKTHAAQEFEWHEGRDHVFYVVEGSTTYELGGTPRGGHGNGPGEWLAPVSEGATHVTLNKGDTVVIRRGTPHKRTTPESVILILTSPMGFAKTT
jgi:mannose-6-phosphate isomerase-like protein (cupin superfamily)